LLSGGALGLVVGYCLLTYWGGAHFNVLELPLPWLRITAQSPLDEPGNSSQGTAARPSGAVAPTAGAAKPQSQASPRLDMAVPQAAGGPRLTAASHAGPVPSPGAGSVAQLSGAERAVGDGASHNEQGVTVARTAVNASLRVESHRACTAQETTPKYSSEDLTQAARAARDATACPTCKSTGLVSRSVSGRESSQRCPVCRGLGGAGITAEVYGKLCHLAEVATHADGNDPDVLKAQQELASVFRKAADRPEKQAAIGRHAAQRMTTAQQMAAASSEAKGILLVGTIDRKEQLGAYHGTRLILLGEPAPVMILSGTAVPFAPGQRMIIAGSIVVDPAVELADYPGPRGPAVWGGMPLKLEE
jgi:hypothetical protein